jgi:hypothetical protein
MQRFVWAVVAVAAVAAAASAEPLKPAVEVRLVSATDLAPVIEYGGGLFGQGEQLKQVGDLIKAFAESEKGLEGLDLKRPLGFYTVLAEKVEDSTLVLMIPVADADGVVGLMSGKLGLDPTKDEKTGVYSLEVPNFPATVYFRFSDKYMYATLRSADGVAKDKLIAPSTFFADKTVGILTAAVHFDRIPADLRKAVYGQLELQLKEGADKNADPASKRINEFLVDAGVDAVKTLLTEGDTLTAALDVEPKSDDIKLTLNVTPKGGSTLGKTLASWADRDSVAAAVAAVKNPVFAAGLNFALPPEAKKKFAALAEGLAKDAVDNAKGDEQAATKMMTDSLLPTLKAGDLQLGVVVSDAGKGKIGLTAAAKTVDGQEIEKTAKFFGQFLPPEQGQFTADADKAGTRNAHKLTFAKTDGVPFGSDTLWVLTGDDLLAVHTDPKADGVKAIGNAKPAKAPMLNLEMSWVRFARMVNSAEADTIKNVVNSVFESDKTDGLDTLKITGTGGKQLTLNFTLKGKAFAFLAAMNQ